MGSIEDRSLRNTTVRSIVLRTRVLRLDLPGMTGLIPCSLEIGAERTQNLAPAIERLGLPRFFARFPPEHSDWNHARLAFGRLVSTPT